MPNKQYQIKEPETQLKMVSSSSLGMHEGLSSVCHSDKKGKKHKKHKKHDAE